MIWGLGAGSLALWAMAGATAGPAVSGTAYREGAVKGGGTVSGVVRFAGPPPRPYVIWVTKDADVFGEKIPDERLLISEDGKVQNATVTLEGVGAGKPWPRASVPLENRGGRFVPHVLAARRGAPLTVVNADPRLHNVHGYQGGRTVFNRALPRGARVREVLGDAGILEVVCDVHDWMNGWILVVDHPYFAITAADGAYEIADIPPGSYRLVAWHERLGRLEQRVTVAPGQVTRTHFTFRPAPAPGRAPSGR